MHSPWTRDNPANFNGEPDEFAVELVPGLPKTWYKVMQYQMGLSIPILTASVCVYPKKELEALEGSLMNQAALAKYYELGNRFYVSPEEDWIME
jgi:hypothetical protein